MEENCKKPTGKYTGFKVTVILLLFCNCLISSCTGFAFFMHIENHDGRVDHNTSKAKSNEGSIESINRQLESINKRLNELDGN